ncbi:MAG TPA: FMN-binding negative transcriptional regulator [Acidimicrobiales bacterium]
MYPPPAYHVTDPELAHRAIDAFPLAAVVSTGPDGLVATHIPLLVERTGGAGTLIGHLDRENPHVGLLDGADVLALFRGPDTYISPTTYVTRQLPTWNYVFVEARGTARLVEDPERVRSFLVRLIDHVEPRPGGWALADDDRRVPPLLPHIVGVEIPLRSIEGRFKFSQEKVEADRERAAERMLGVSSPDGRRFLHEVLGYDGRAG